MSNNKDIIIIILLLIIIIIIIIIIDQESYAISVKLIRNVNRQHKNV